MDHYITQKHIHYKQREPYNYDSAYEQRIGNQLMIGDDVAARLNVTSGAITRNTKLQKLKIKFNGRTNFYLRDEIEAYANS